MPIATKFTCVLVALLLLTACVGVPLDYPKAQSTEIKTTGDTALAHFSSKWRN